MKISRRTFLYLTTAAICAAGALLLAYSYFIEPQRLTVARYRVGVAGWDNRFDGLRIVAISDIHAGSNGSDADKLRRVVETVNNERPDIIVLLGDYVSRRTDDRSQLRMPLAEMSEALKGMKAVFGVFAVLGNHDGVDDGPEISASLAANGYRVLDGEVVEIEKDGAKIRLLGLKDHLTIKSWKQFSDDAKEILARSGEDDSNIIALEHSPDVLPMLTEGDQMISPHFKILLAGHTHGGQIFLPVLGRPIVPSFYGQKYAYGHIKENGVDMFVTSGVGTNVLPFRFLVPPEIAIVEIHGV